MDIFLLLPEEMGGDRVQGVGTELVITLDDLEDIKLDTAFNIWRKSKGF